MTWVWCYLQFQTALLTLDLLSKISFLVLNTVPRFYYWRNLSTFKTEFHLTNYGYEATLNRVLRLINNLLTVDLFYDSLSFIIRKLRFPLLYWSFNFMLISYFAFFWFIIVFYYFIITCTLLMSLRHWYSNK